MNAHTSQFIESQLRQFFLLAGLGHDVHLSKGQAAKLVAAVETIQRQRDELLEALESIAEDTASTWVEDAARAAIAKAKGGAE